MDQIDQKPNQFPCDTSKSRAFRVCENSIFGWNGLVSLSLEKAVLGSPSPGSEEKHNDSLNWKKSAGS